MSRPDLTPNAKILAHTILMDEQGWRAARRVGIGGSDIASIVGKNPYRTALDVYLDKIGEGIDQEEREAMKWGKLLEPAIAKEFSERTKFELIDLCTILQHKKYHWALANVDRIIVKPGSNGILEIKTTRNPDRWEDGEIPDYYQLQAQWYMWVTGLKYAYFSTLVGGQKLLIPDPISFDNELAGMMCELAERFWNNVQNKIPPPPDGSKAATEIMKKLYSKPNKGAVIFLPSDAPAFIEEYNSAKELEASAKKRKTEAENNLKNMLGNNENGKSDKYIVSWTGITSNRLNTTKLKEEQPEIYEKYLEPSDTRRFEVKLNKGGK